MLSFYAIRANHAHERDRWQIIFRHYFEERIVAARGELSKFVVHRSLFLEKFIDKLRSRVAAVLHTHNVVPTENENDKQRAREIIRLTCRLLREESPFLS